VSELPGPFSGIEEARISNIIPNYSSNMTMEKEVFSITKEAINQDFKKLACDTTYVTRQDVFKTCFWKISCEMIYKLKTKYGKAWSVTVGDPNNMSNAILGQLNEFKFYLGEWFFSIIQFNL
jgi:hypothetical protein